MLTAYDAVHDLAVLTDLPTVVVPVHDVDGEPELYFACFNGSDRWLALCSDNPACAAIACCQRALANSRDAGYLPSVP